MTQHPFSMCLNWSGFCSWFQCWAECRRAQWPL